MKINTIYLTLVCLVISLSTLQVQNRPYQRFRENIPLDSILLSDPAILADQNTKMYYMTGTGGRMWKSKDLKFWSGPFNATKIDPNSWMGPQPQIWAAELHAYKGTRTGTVGIIGSPSVRGRFYGG